MEPEVAVAIRADPDASNVEGRVTSPENARIRY